MFLISQHLSDNEIVHGSCLGLECLYMTSIFRPECLSLSSLTVSEFSVFPYSAYNVRPWQAFVGQGACAKQLFQARVFFPCKCIQVRMLVHSKHLQDKVLVRGNRCRLECLCQALISRLERLSLVSICRLECLSIACSFRPKSLFLTIRFRLECLPVHCMQFQAKVLVKGKRFRLQCSPFASSFTLKFLPMASILSKSACTQQVVSVISGQRAYLVQVF